MFVSHFEKRSFTSISDVDCILNDHWLADLTTNSTEKTWLGESQPCKFPVILAQSVLPAASLKQVGKFAVAGGPEYSRS
jgi:hypothetical protein